MQSRFNRLPFSPSYEFRATRAFVMQGIAYQHGDAVDKSGIETRRLRQMYEARMVEPILDDEPAKVPAVLKAPAAKKAAPAKAAAVEKTAAPVKTEGGLVHRGFGKWYQVDADGKDVAGPFTKEQAEAMKK